jgi:hypothetical protein
MLVNVVNKPVLNYSLALSTLNDKNILKSLSSIDGEMFWIFGNKETIEEQPYWRSSS